jgi:hypothetical protein
MPKSKRPSFLTRLKEQKRRDKAAEKREARRARQRAKSTPPDGDADTGEPGEAERSEPETQSST